MSRPNPYPLRIDEQVMSDIKELAKVNSRSVNGEIEFALKQYIQAMKKSPNIFQISRD